MAVAGHDGVVDGDRRGRHVPGLVGAEQQHGVGDTVGLEADAGADVGDRRGSLRAERRAGDVVL